MPALFFSQQVLYRFSEIELITAILTHIRKLRVSPCQVGSIFLWRFDHEIFATAIFSLPLIQEGQL